MGFKDLSSEIHAPAKKDFEIVGIPFPVTITAPSMDLLMGVGNNTVTASELFSRTIRDDDGGKWSPKKWDMFLSDKGETITELFEAINSFGTLESEQDIDAAKKS